MGFSKDSHERKMFADFYALCEKYWDVREEFFKDDEFWQVLIDDTDNFCRKYKTNEDHFAVHLAALIIERVEAQSRHIIPYCAVYDGAKQLVDALVERRCRM